MYVCTRAKLENPVCDGGPGMNPLLRVGVGRATSRLVLARLEPVFPWLGLARSSVLARVARV